MTTKVALAGTALGALLAVGIGAALVRGEIEPPVRPFQVAGALSPASVRFGDTIRATLTISIDPAHIKPSSLRVEPEVAPFNLAGPVRPRSNNRSGTIEIRYVFPLLCLRAACLPRQPGGKRIFPLRAVVHYRLDGRERTRTASIGALALRSRLRERDVAEPRWHLALSPLGLDARLTPILLAALLAGSALAAAATAVLLLRSEDRTEVRAFAGPGRDGSELERALQLLRDAVELGVPTPQRRALDRLARELSKANGARLEDEARVLAWSRQGPVGARVARLDEAVAELVQGSP